MKTNGPRASPASFLPSNLGKSGYSKILPILKYRAVVVELEQNVDPFYEKLVGLGPPCKFLACRACPLLKGLQFGKMGLFQNFAYFCLQRHGGRTWAKFEPH